MAHSELEIEVTLCLWRRFHSVCPYTGPIVRWVGRTSLAVQHLSASSVGVNQILAPSSCWGSASLFNTESKALFFGFVGGVGCVFWYVLDLILFAIKRGFFFCFTVCGSSVIPLKRNDRVVMECCHWQMDSQDSRWERAARCSRGLPAMCQPMITMYNYCVVSTLVV